jgi:lysine 2,3-aminomutase
MEELRELSGLCQPTYVLDLPGGHAKIPLGPNYVQGRDGHRWTFTDHHGAAHPYDEVLPEDDGRDHDP